MNALPRLVRRLLLYLILVSAIQISANAAAEFKIAQESGHVAISLGDQPLATYVFRDPKIYRPYFAHVDAPSGAQVTRHHPPREGIDSADHAGLHPGIWMAFSDLNGNDFWRNKALVEHEKFLSAPAVRDGEVMFSVQNRYLGAGRKQICTETARYSFRQRPHGVLLIWDAEFQSTNGPVTFGDEEEMGLGIRVATAMTVTNGGTILDSGGKKNESQTRGQAPQWVDYAGVVDGQAVGICLMADPANRQKSWTHSRDYGLLVLNPFGGKTVGGGESSSLRLEPGDTLRLRYGVLLHGNVTPADLQSAYNDFVVREERR